MATRQETGEPIITNSHDMMSVFMIAAFRRQDEKENSKRRTRQIEIFDEYQAGMDTCTTPNQAYELMKKFSVKYLATYLLQEAGFTEQDIQILPMESITPNLANEIRSYTNALRIMTGLENDTSSSDQCVNSLFMSCIRSAIHKKQQSIVGQSILEGMGQDISEEGHDPNALEPSVEVL